MLFPIVFCELPFGRYTPRDIYGIWNQQYDSICLNLWPLPPNGNHNIGKIMISVTSGFKGTQLSQKCNRIGPGLMRQEVLASFRMCQHRRKQI